MLIDEVHGGASWPEPTLVALYDRPPGPHPHCMWLWQYAYGFHGHQYSQEVLGVDLDQLHEHARAQYEATGNWDFSFEVLRCLLFKEQRIWRWMEQPVWDGSGPPGIMSLYEAVRLAWPKQYALRTSRYDGIRSWLDQQQPDGRVIAAWETLNRLSPLPASSHHPTWWANARRRGQPQTRAWVEAGYSVRDPWTLEPPCKLIVFDRFGS